MKKLLQFSNQDGNIFFVEINEQAVSEPVRASLNDNDARGVIQDTKGNFEKTLEPLKDISNSIIKNIADISCSPSEIQVELGLKITAKAGIILTSLDSEAHLKIILKWGSKK